MTQSPTQQLEVSMDSTTIDVQTRQRVDALARANRVRIARAALKRRIADGHVSAAQVILLHPSEAEGMPVADVLTSQRHWGDTRCRRLLVGVGLKESKPIGSMTERQRLALAARLSAGATSVRTYPVLEGNGVPQ
jgi:hypothetical protein